MNDYTAWIWLNNSHSSSVAKADNDFSRSVRGGQLHERHGNFTFYLIDLSLLWVFLKRWSHERYDRLRRVATSCRNLNAKKSYKLYFWSHCEDPFYD